MRQLSAIQIDTYPFLFTRSGNRNFTDLHLRSFRLLAIYHPVAEFSNFNPITSRI